LTDRNAKLGTAAREGLHTSTSLADVRIQDVPQHRATHGAAYHTSILREFKRINNLLGSVQRPVEICGTVQIADKIYIVPFGSIPVREYACVIKALVEVVRHSDLIGRHAAESGWRSVLDDSDPRAEVTCILTPYVSALYWAQLSIDQAT
jgi:hypothetical protein